MLHRPYIYRTCSFNTAIILYNCQRQNIVGAEPRPKARIGRKRSAGTYTRTLTHSHTHAHTPNVQSIHTYRLIGGIPFFDLLKDSALITSSMPDTCIETQVSWGRSIEALKLIFVLFCKLQLLLPQDNQPENPCTYLNSWDRIQSKPLC